MIQYFEHRTQDCPTSARKSAKTTTSHLNATPAIRVSSASERDWLSPHIHRLGLILSPSSGTCRPPAHLSSSTHNPISPSSTSTLVPKQISRGDNGFSRLASESRQSSTHHGAVSCGTSLAFEDGSTAAPERTRESFTTASDGARDLLGELPMEVRDTIFGQHTKHALAVNIVSDVPS